MEVIAVSALTYCLTAVVAYYSRSCNLLHFGTHFQDPSQATPPPQDLDDTICGPPYVPPCPLGCLVGTSPQGFVGAVEVAPGKTTMFAAGANDHGQAWGGERATDRTLARLPSCELSFSSRISHKPPHSSLSPYVVFPSPSLPTYALLQLCRT